MEKLNLQQSAYRTKILVKTKNKLYYLGVCNNIITDSWDYSDQQEFP